MEQRITYYDSLRGIAIIAVVFIHSFSFKDDSMMAESIIFRQMINFSVPLFLALSGFFLANKNFTSKNDFIDFLKKQIPRVYVPYAVWSCVFIFLNVILLKQRSMIGMLKNFVFFQTAPIFYYVALILQYYLLLPILKKYLKKALLYSVIISFSICIFIFLNKYFSQVFPPLIIYAGNFLTWIIFFVLGMYLRNNKFKVKPYVIVGFIFFFLILSVLETYVQILLFGKITDAVSAVKISSFLYSASVIIFFLNYERKWKIFSNIGQLSYGIFLMHLLTLILIKSILSKLNFTLMSFSSEILIGIINVAVSYGVCFSIKKINSDMSHKYFGI